MRQRTAAAMCHLLEKKTLSLKLVIIPALSFHVPAKRRVLPLSRRVVAEQLLSIEVSAT